MKEQTIYKCDFCDAVFSSKSSCADHECAAHLRNGETFTNAQLATALRNMSTDVLMNFLSSPYSHYRYSQDHIMEILDECASRLAKN